jgi:hypothetical protein
MARNVVVAIALFLALVHLGRVDEIAAGSDFKPSSKYWKARDKLLGIWWPYKTTDFQLTKIYLGEIFDELRTAKKQGLALGKYEQEHERFEALVGVCERDVNKCETVFKEIERLREANKKHTATLIPYLDECEKIQFTLCRRSEEEQFRIFESSEYLDFMQSDMTYSMIKNRMNSAINLIGQVESEFGGKLHKYYAGVRDTYREYLDLEGDHQPCDEIYKKIKAVRQTSPRFKNYFDGVIEEQKKRCGGYHFQD